VEKVIHGQEIWCWNHLLYLKGHDLAIALALVAYCTMAHKVAEFAKLVDDSEHIKEGEYHFELPPAKRFVGSEVLH
jgi:hypothetical protein